MKKAQSAKEIFAINNFLERLKNTKTGIHEEFQDYGFRLASRLDDLRHKALYIKFAKEVPRSLLEEVVEFTLDYPIKNGSKARIFMWRLKEKCKERGVELPKVKKKVKIIKQKLQLTLLESDSLLKKKIKKDKSNKA